MSSNHRVLCCARVYYCIRFRTRQFNSITLRQYLLFVVIFNNWSDRNGIFYNAFVVIVVVVLDELSRYYLVLVVRVYIVSISVVYFSFKSMSLSPMLYVCFVESNEEEKGILIGMDYNYTIYVVS